MYISVYNLFYTSLPVLALGVFEQDVSDKDSLDYPKLYTPGLTNALFNTKEFIRSVMHGAFSSLVLFLIPYKVYKDGVGADGLMLSDHMTLASVVATILILDNTAQVSHIGMGTGVHEDFLKIIIDYRSPSTPPTGQYSTTSPYGAA